MTLLPPVDNRAVTFLPWGVLSPPPGVTQRSGPCSWGRGERPSPECHALAALPAACAGGGITSPLWARPLPLPLHRLPGDLGKSLPLIWEDCFSILYGILEPSPAYFSCSEVNCGGVPVGESTYITSDHAGCIHSSLHPFSICTEHLLYARQCTRKGSRHN